VKILEAGSMSAAAERLGLAQPALGAQIRLLEEELGVKLLLRHSRGVAPTQAGRLLQERARAILADVDRARLDVRAFGRRDHDHVSLGVNPSMVLMLGSELLPRARAEMPNVSLSLVEERTPVLLDALQRGQVNVAFLYNVEDAPGLDRRAVLEEDLLLVTAPHKAPPGESVSLAEALEHDLVIAGARGVIRRIVESEARRLSLTLRLAYEVHSVSSMRAMILRGEAASVMPFSLAAEELRSGALVARRIDRPALTRTLYVVRPAEREAIASEAALETYLDHTVESLLGRVAPYARGFR
jgi:LysR family nitrogen assimilation transcriptional regulator